MEFLLNQIYIFVIMFVFGLLLGLTFDLYRRIIKRILHNKFWINLADLLFGFLTGMGGFIILIYTNWGELRFYVFLAILFGFILYFYSISLGKLIK